MAYVGFKPKCDCCQVFFKAPSPAIIAPIQGNGLNTDVVGDIYLPINPGDSI